MKPNDSGPTIVIAGNQRWIEARDVLIQGLDEAGNEVGQSEGPFRSSDDASRWVKHFYPGFDFSVLVTHVPEGTRFRRAPKKEKKR